jgi:hypothetical protein
MVAVSGSTHRLWIAPALLALVGGCYPEVDPPWLVTQPRLMRIRSAVVATGPHSRPLEEDPPDRIRAQFLPGDSIRLQGLVIGPEGLVDAPDDGIWFQCGTLDWGCRGLLSEGTIPDCGPVRAFQEETCRLGRTDEQPFSVADMDDPSWAAVIGRLPVTFGHIAGTDPERGSEDCVRRYAGRRNTDEDLWDCVFGTTQSIPGPRWTLDAAKSELGVEVEPPPDEVPDEVVAQEPDLRPEPLLDIRIEGTSVTGVEVGGTLELEPGQHVSVQPQLANRDLQTYFEWNSSGFVESSEGEMWWALAGTRNLDGTGTEVVGTFEWTVSADDDGATIVFAGREHTDRNEAWAWLRLRVDSQ